jgi:hypothetical protein
VYCLIPQHGDIPLITITFGTKSLFQYWHFWN